MRKLVALFVTLLLCASLTASEPKIRLELDLKTKLLYIYNGYDHAIYCKVIEDSQVKDFYVYKKQRSRPIKPSNNFNWWCKVPELTV